MTDMGFALDEFCRRTETADDSCGVALTVRNGRRFINLRCDAADDAALQRIAGILGQPLPLQANTVTRALHTAYWLGPDEWLIETDAAQEALPDALRQAVSGDFVSIVDVSDGMVALFLAGPQAVDVLAKGCTLDLHPDTFADGDCAQTTLAKASMVISRRDGGFDILVRRSFAEYAALWLRHAAGEFGFGVTST